MAGAYEEIACILADDALLRPGGFALTDRALEICSLSPGARVVDIGCGTGGTVARLIDRYGFHAFGADPSDFLLRKGGTRDRVSTLVRAVGEDLPFKSGVWDCVLVECSLSVAGNPERVLHECRRLLKEKGRLALSDIYIRNPVRIPGAHCLLADCCLKGALSKKELLTALGDAGFRILVWEDHSAALKHYAAKLLLSCDSTEEFRSLFYRGSNVGDNRGGFLRTVASARPGYFLLVAEKCGAC